MPALIQVRTSVISVIGATSALQPNSVQAPADVTVAILSLDLA